MTAPTFERVALIGIGLIVLVLIASQAFEFYTLDWLIHSFWSQIVLAVVILFQPELRRTLAVEEPDRIVPREFVRANAASSSRR